MVFLLLLGATLVIVAGCGGGGAPESSSKAQSTSSDVGDARLEALVYPGAKKEDVDTAGGPMPGNGSSAPPAPGERPEGMPDSSAPPGGFQRPSMLAAYRTSDSIDKVSAWYEEQLSGKTGFEEVSMPSRGAFDQDGSVKIYSFKSGDTTLMLMVRNDTRDGGGTVITVGEAPEGMPEGPPVNQGQ